MGYPSAVDAMTPRGTMMSLLAKGMAEHEDFTPVCVLGYRGPANAPREIAVLMPESLQRVYRASPAVGHWFIGQVGLVLKAQLLEPQEHSDQ
jgi:hypothetical protein